NCESHLHGARRIPCLRARDAHGNVVLDVLKRIFDETLKDDLSGLAARCAYALVFALFPFLLLVLSLASFLPASGPSGPLPPELLDALPPAVRSILLDRIAEIAQQRNATTLTFSAILTLYSASSGMATIVTAVNRAWD